MNMFYEIGPRVRARRNTEHFSQQEIYICLIEPGESPLRFRVFFTWVFAAMNNFVIKAVFSSSRRSEFCIFIKLFHQYSWAEQLFWVSRNYSLTQWTLIYIKVANVVDGISELAFCPKFNRLVEIFLHKSNGLLLLQVVFLRPRVFLWTRWMYKMSEGRKIKD